MAIVPKVKHWGIKPTFPAAAPPPHPTPAPPGGLNLVVRCFHVKGSIDAKQTGRK